MGYKVITSNRKAKYDYEMIDTYTAGLVLTGTEVKSLKNGDGTIKGGFLYFKGGELYISGLSIPPQRGSSNQDHEPDRLKKALLNRKELNYLEKSLEVKGLTLVPIDVHVTETGLIKMNLALAKGKKLYDKRETIKLRDLDRDEKRKNL